MHQLIDHGAGRFIFACSACGQTAESLEFGEGEEGVCPVCQHEDQMDWSEMEGWDE